jgi:hypothetical protein
VPLTSVAEEVVVAFPTNPYVRWLNHKLIFGLFWHTLFVATNASLLLLLPFAYFYKEALGRSPLLLCHQHHPQHHQHQHHHHTGTSTFLERFFEAITVMALFSLLLISFFSLVYTIFFFSPSEENLMMVNNRNRNTVVAFFVSLLALCDLQKQLLLANTFTSALGSLLLLIALPFGSWNISKWTTLLMRLAVHHPPSSSTSSELQTVNIIDNNDEVERLQSSQEERGRGRGRQGLNGFLFKSVVVLLSIANVFFPIYMVVFYSSSSCYLFVQFRFRFPYISLPLSLSLFVSFPKIDYQSGVRGAQHVFTCFRGSLQSSVRNSSFFVVVGIGSLV